MDVLHSKKTLKLTAVNVETEIYKNQENVLTGKQFLLLIPLTRFYCETYNIEKLKTILDGKSKLSLRVVDWFVTNYSKKNLVMYNLKKLKEKYRLSDVKENDIESDGDSGIDIDTTEYYSDYFNVFSDYRSQLKSLNKKNFDPFCRRERIKFFYGKKFGSDGETIGEVCFNTGMTGYQEILTDPSYCQQIVTMTVPHIGNYGVNPDDYESDRIQVAGFVVKEATKIPSNWRSTQSLGDYLKDHNIVGIQKIDTRALTRHIRDNGAMNGIISTIDSNLESLKKKLSQVPNMTGLDLAQKVTCKDSYLWSTIQNGQYKVASIDFGIKHNILQLLESLPWRFRLSF